MDFKPAVVEAERLRREGRFDDALAALRSRHWPQVTKGWKATYLVHAALATLGLGDLEKVMALMEQASELKVPPRSRSDAKQVVTEVLKRRVAKAVASRAYEIGEQLDEAERLERLKISTQPPTAAYGGGRETVCFRCRTALNSRRDEKCPACRWIECPGCRACGCSW